MPSPYRFPFFFEEYEPRTILLNAKVYYKVLINGAEVLKRKNTLRLNSELGQRISTAKVTIIGEEYWATPAYSCVPVVSLGGATFPHLLDEVKIDRKDAPFVSCSAVPVVSMGGHSTYLDHYFAGYLVAVEKDKVGGVKEGNRVLYHCEAQDYNMLPTKITITESYAAKTEQFILDDLFATYLPEVDTSTYVESSGATITLDWTRKTLTEALEELAGIFEKRWYIDYEFNLHYFTPAAGTAPFALSDEPFGTTLIPYKNIKHREDITGIINRVTVVGDNGAVVVTRTSAASYAEYGRYFEGKVVDNAIDTVAWANAVGDAVLAELAFAKTDGRLMLYQEGLVVGQKVRIVNIFRGLDAYYLVQSVRLALVGASEEKIDITYGDYKPRLTDLLLKISKEERKE